jgi:ubiquinone/menaquinone biosynthesis C-methylase UbiE
VSKVHDLEKDTWSNKRDVMRYYNTMASAYTELHSKEQQLKYRAALQHLSTTDAAILDLGCGTGLLFSYISTKSLLVGIDLSSQMVRRAARRICAHPEGHVICADVDYLPLRDSIFDTVFAFTLLQNIQTPQNLLQEVSRVLKDDSTFILSALKSVFPYNMIMSLLCQSNLQVTTWLSTTSTAFLVICKKVTFYSKNTR